MTNPVRSNSPTRLGRVSRIFSPGSLTWAVIAATLVATGSPTQVQASPFGDGSDGAVTVAATVMLTHDMNYTDLTVSAGAVLNTNGYVVRVSGTLLNNGTITDATRGGAGGTGGIGGVGGHGFAPHVPPQSGQGGTAGGPPALSGAGAGGNGGGSGGGGGGAWDTGWDEAVTGGNGGTGGTGGNGGGVVRIFVSTLTNLGVIHANGSNGNPETNGGPGEYFFYDPGIFWAFRDMAGGGGGGAAGGKGGNGGTVEIFYGTLSVAGTIQANGGAGGPSRPGGPGSSTTEDAGDEQIAENGALGGGSPVGGQGGFAQIGIGSSSPGASGSPGAPGVPGTVTIEPAGCCEARVGDANSSGDDEPTIGDVSVLINAKLIAGTCDGIITCLEEADINQSAAGAATCDDITIGDISTLIDYLFITGSTLGLPACL